MRLLLDTHIWLWYLQGSDRLSVELQNRIRDPRVQLWLSPISIWETLMLAEKGRINLGKPSQQWISDTLKVLKVKEVTLNNDIAILSRAIQLPHQDPAARFIAAMALYYDLVLATVDRNLTASEQLTTLS
ncbi:type II toxin-antitoxin system VapC family toxin [Synechococcus moorigangaii CMS01]|nr:type II toxin-antitoxin system VapC family toxin [Synechococcus moorigangaii CMS01]